MRTAFIETLYKEAVVNPDVMLLVGDLGFGVVTTFARDFPKQFINAGVAEQNMTGMAAGLAMCGKIPFTYSIANFPVMRCLEQIRNDVAYHNTNVRIVAVGGGFCYGALGMSHHATEDLAITRAIPNMTVIAPGDPVEAQLVTKALITHQGPVYLRLGRAGEPTVHQTIPQNFAIGKALQIQDGKDLTLVAIGSMVYIAKQVAQNLQKQGVSCRVLSIHTLKPIDTEAILAAAEETGGIMTLEEHTVVGGLGSAVGEVLLDHNIRPKIFRRFGIQDMFTQEVGTQEHLREFHQMDTQSLTQTIGELFSS